VISYETLLEVFFDLHDPTTPDQQGADVGTQYRSAIFYHDAKQKETAEAVKRRVDESKMYHDPAVTEIVPLEKFYPAEDYHQDFYNQNENYPYCSIIIAPKLRKLYKEFDPLTV
jgi:peptide-methionine (S)-S-oxide reductase